MKGLTLWQPWCQFLATGVKEYETRSWPTNYRGEIAIHASKSKGYCQMLAQLLVDAGIHDEATLKMLDSSAWCFGAVIGVATLVLCEPTLALRENMTPREIALGDWAPGRYAWSMKNAVLLKEPFTWKGAQGLWSISPELEAQIKARM